MEMAFLIPTQVIKSMCHYGNESSPIQSVTGISGTQFNGTQHSNSSWLELLPHRPLQI